ncbi:CCR4-NOT transcription complex subunit 3, partial [Tremellales sp. Uapishka_1]
MALRKLQTEIDRTLKTVGQGVELFENTFDKLHHASNTTQKEKLELDLKTQIKKLQRMRDQIKAWLGNNDIKEKGALLDNRKLIESQMERFKALEKEMKMKAFSKEGLIAASKLGPEEKAKRDCLEWIGTTTDELSRQIEQTEAEAEALQAQAGKKKKSTGDRLSELDSLNERRTWHIGRLEVVQRMLENGQLSVEQVETIQEDVKYFVEANTEEDFDYDAGLYDELNLQDEDVDYLQEYAQTDELSNLDTASITDGGDLPKTPLKEEKKATPTGKTSTSEDATSIPTSPTSARKVPSKKSTLDLTKAEPAKAAATPPSKEPPVPVKSVAALPPIRYAAAAAAAVAAPIAAAVAALAPAPVPAPAPPTEAASSPIKVKQELVEEKVEEPIGVESPVEIVKTEVEAPQQAAAVPPPQPIQQRSQTPQLSLPQTNGHSLPPPPGLSSASPLAPISQPQASPYPSSVTNGNGISSANGSSASATLPPPGYAPHAETSRAGSTAYSPRKAEGVLGHLMNSFDIAKEQSERRAGDVNELNAALEISYSNAPQQIDAEPPRYYHPKHPIKTPSYYPQQKLAALEDKNIYSRLDLDQLFYIFYYMTGTYEQWLAARELKRQSWRFHKQYLTWFQRAHNPQAITEDYEQGGYFYFDWENSWCQRKKSDFRFEYRWLSDH